MVSTVMSRVRRAQSSKGGRGKSITAAKSDRTGVVLAALIGAAGAVVAAVVTAIGAGFVKDGQSPNVSGDGGRAPASVEGAPTVGGVWVHPHDQHATIGPDGVLVLQVDAHSGRGDFDVSRVQFTTDWDGWHVLCTDPALLKGNSSY
ncbi:MAG: hypothetical protein ACRDPA_00605 [Solirubrobacteraceae bacterium]